jgi:hypothetical protein
MKLTEAVQRVNLCMWDRLAIAPFALQAWFCPSRTSDTVLFGLLAWCCGAIFGSVCTALVLSLSPSLRRCLLRGLAYALAEAVPDFPRGDRLQRYRQ